MFPWFWIWSPQWHLPWSGDVAQKIAPRTSWFFDAIAPIVYRESIDMNVAWRAARWDTCAAPQPAST